MEKRYLNEVQKLGQTVRLIREGKGMSQLDLELVSGINRTEISRIENGLKNLEFMTLIKLVESLEIELVDLFA